MNVFLLLVIVLILYSDFFCNVCFLRKRNKMYLDFKEKNVDPIQSVLAWWFDEPSLLWLILSFSSLPPPSHPKHISFSEVHVSWRLFFFPPHYCFHKWTPFWLQISTVLRLGSRLKAGSSVYIRHLFLCQCLNFHWVSVVALIISSLEARECNLSSSFRSLLQTAN